MIDGLGNLGFHPGTIFEENLQIVRVTCDCFKEVVFILLTFF